MCCGVITKIHKSPAAISAARRLPRSRSFAENTRPLGAARLTPKKLQALPSLRSTRIPFLKRSRVFSTFLGKQIPNSSPAQAEAHRGKIGQLNLDLWQAWGLKADFDFLTAALDL